jgi:hypothetical protein
MKLLRIERKFKYFNWDIYMYFMKLVLFEINNF